MVREREGMCGCVSDFERGMAMFITYIQTSSEMAKMGVRNNRAKEQTEQVRRSGHRQTAKNARKRAQKSKKGMQTNIEIRTK